MAKKARLSGRVKRSKRRPKRSPRRGKRSGIVTNLVTEGIKSLLSALPGGPVISALAVVIFKALGVTSNFSFDENSQMLASADTKHVMLGAKFLITPSDIMAGSTMATKCRLDYTPTGGSKTLVDGFVCSYQQARIIHLALEIIPVNKAGEMQGFWTAGLCPLSTRVDADKGNDNLPRPSALSDWIYDTTVPDPDCVKRMPYVKSGPAKRPLTLHYTPRAFDGLAYSFNPMNAEVIGVAIVFEDPNRTSYTEFTANDFACTIKVRGRLEVRDPIMEQYSNDNKYGRGHYIDYVRDVLSPIAMTLKTNDPAHPIVNITRNDQFLCKPNADRMSCKVQGLAYTGKRQDGFELVPMLTDGE